MQNTQIEEQEKILEQISAAIDDEDPLPQEFFDTEHAHYYSMKNIWSTQKIIRQSLIQQEIENNKKISKTMAQNYEQILYKIQQQEPIHTNKAIEINNNISDTLQRLKKFVHIIFPIGITACFLFASLIMHNRLNNNMDDNSEQYFSEHNYNNNQTYNIASIDNIPDNQYIDSFSLKQ